MSFRCFQIDAIEGAKLLLRDVHQDHRGNFSELWRDQELFDLTGERFVQTNQSFSTMGVLRGMHLQKRNPQAKLVTCLYGAVHDVVFDLRKHSSTYLKAFSITLDWKRGESIFVPAGCAHGFMALSRSAIVHYNCSTYYDPETDGGVLWSSPELSDHFGYENPIVSLKDQSLPTVKQYLADLEEKADEPS